MQVPPVFNGMATAADWMSGASFVALAGGIYFGGHGYLAFVVGWTGGYVLVNALMAPYLRKFGCYTVPDFIGTRYGGNLARLLCRGHSGGCVLHVCDGADQRDRNHRCPGPANTLRSRCLVPACSAFCCARCLAACGR